MKKFINWSKASSSIPMIFLLNLSIMVTLIFVYIWFGLTGFGAYIGMIWAFSTLWLTVASPFENGAFLSISIWNFVWIISILLACPH